MLGNFFGGANGVGICPYTTDRQMDPGDNGVYVIDGWEIVERYDYDGDFSWNPNNYPNGEMRKIIPRV